VGGFEAVNGKLRSQLTVSSWQQAANQ